MAEEAIDRVKERSRFDTVVARDPVKFSLNCCDLIQWEQKVPHLPNRTGGDMYIYPGFILYRASKQAFALIDFRDVTLTFVPTQFTERETIPSDTQILGYAWAKSNKDGSPDRRFQGNYQIPMAHYGELLFTSPEGLDVRYLCSDAALGERFAKAWAAFRMSFSYQSGRDDGATQRGQSFEGIDACLDGLRSANAKFLNDIQPATGERTMLKDDFIAYMARVVGFINAAKGYLENPSLSQTSSVRARFRHAIETLEVARAQFEDSVHKGEKIDTQIFTSYSEALTAFYDAIAQFFETRAGGGAKDRRSGKV